jgi:hypothetical protein
MSVAVKNNIYHHLNNIKTNILALRANDFYELCLPSIIFSIVGFLILLIGLSEKKKFENLHIDKFVLKKEYLDLFLILGIGYIIVSTFLLNIICKIGYATISWFLTGISLLFLIGLFLVVYVFKLDVVKTIKMVSNEILNGKRCKKHNMNVLLCKHMHKNDKNNDSDDSSSDD